MAELEGRINKPNTLLALIGVSTLYVSVEYGRDNQALVTSPTILVNQKSWFCITATKSSSQRKCIGIEDSLNLPFLFCARSNSQRIERSCSVKASATPGKHPLSLAFADIERSLFVMEQQICDGLPSALRRSLAALAEPLVCSDATEKAFSLPHF